ncbi:MAG: glycosyltransferase [Gammaproteobacteria bacterium]|nr:glycosyltransferase [Gammaproteobacteria bacterium]
MNNGVHQPGTVAFVLKGYPRLSESFIAEEIRALEERGLDILIISLRRPTDPAVHPVHQEIQADVVYLPEYLYRELGRVVRAWRGARRLPGYAAARRIWLRDLRRDPTANCTRRFGQALVLGYESAAQITHLHAHFLHTPASVARYASVLTGIPWSCSAHAKDIWTIPEWEKRQKLADCAWITTCTRANATHLRRLAPNPNKVTLNYHGLNLTRFPPPEAARPPRDGRDPEEPVLILSVGRTVDKKGYDDLLHALSRLPAAHHWRFVHIGGGECLPALKRLSVELAIDRQVTWLGALPQQEVLSWYRRADMFVLACRISANGDRDGLPNVLLEALTQRLAVLSTRISGIPELIEHEVHGLLAPQRDIVALSGGLERLIRNPDLRLRLGEAGCARVQRHFSRHTRINGIAIQFGLQGAAVA